MRFFAPLRSAQNDIGILFFWNSLISPARATATWIAPGTAWTKRLPSRARRSRRRVWRSLCWRRSAGGRYSWKGNTPLPDNSGVLLNASPHFPNLQKGVHLALSVAGEPRLAGTGFRSRSMTRACQPGSANYALSPRLVGGPCKLVLDIRRPRGRWL